MRRLVASLLLLDTERYARAAFRPAGWLTGLGTLLAVLFLLGLRAPEVGATPDDLRRFVVYGVVRSLLLGIILWAIGTQFHNKRVSFWAVQRAVSLAHLPLLAQAAVPTLVGTALAVFWFVLALGAAAQAVLVLERRQAAAAGALAVCGLLIVMAATPVDLSGVPPL
jgi:hypothetical protein